MAGLLVTDNAFDTVHRKHADMCFSPAIDGGSREQHET